MKTLFARVFVSFWIVLGVIIAGCVATTTMVAWHRIAVLSAINFEQMNSDARTALRNNEEEGLVVQTLVLTFTYSTRWEKTS
ncbi:MAG: hypothetical protein ABJA60_08145 [Nitrosospira sp.]